MTYSTDATTKPVREAPNTEPEHEEMSPVLGREETSSKPHQERATTEPGPEKTSPEAEYEKIKPRPDLNEIFTFDGGYSNPPRNHWFIKGTSGNPNGRPKGSKNKPKPLNDKNLTEIVRSEFYKDVRVNGGRTVSAARAVTRRLVDLALGGNMRAIQLALTSLRAADAADAAQQEAEYNYAVAYIARLETTRCVCSTTGLESGRRMPVPDPKDIILDHINKRVSYTGPRNEVEMMKKLAGRRLSRRD